ncbi:nicotinate (nicotinamide) nucleotide adenylyltransferase [Crocinitomicaceae bacterium]|jgi:nicotinate-nucleotide adenylyltransferase|nr:nicotinate (nicotinamide) nucleotide adenylyltransferase [Crocinitomicaceae bacterium]MDC1403363.1 nicotinate (nicotinamide) nucleotide adenylyltransferase [Crocinitomicaceae bacterium]
MNIGLYFGSFNPIHVGHLIIAQYMIQRDDIDAVWFVVSPQNPFKNKSTLLQDYHRLALVRIATEDEPKFKAEDIEFGLPQPSYTIDTLTYLKEKHPDKNFSLLMGEDNLRGFNKWKNYEQILANHHLFVYPRIEGEPIEHTLKDHASVTFCEDVPLMKISASYIRQQIKEGKSVDFLLNEKVAKYADEMNFYR